MQQSQLNIKNLKVLINTDHQNLDRSLLTDISFTLPTNSVLYLLGPNGAGKSALLNSIMGSSFYTVEGDILLRIDKNFVSKDAYNDKEFIKLLENAKDVINISKLLTHQRAWLGLYLSFQEPVNVAGVKTIDFLYNMYQLRHGETSQERFEKILKPYLKTLQLSLDSLYKELNMDYSGGEKKRLEVLTMLLYKPYLLMLDELDSGLDIDSERLIFGLIKEYLEEYNLSAIVVSHNFRIVNLLKPDKAVVLKNKTVAKTGGADLVEYIINNGYERI